MNRSIKR